VLHEQTAEASLTRAGVGLTALSIARANEPKGKWAVTNALVDRAHKEYSELFDSQQSEVCGTIKLYHPYSNNARYCRQCKQLLYAVAVLFPK
jgi:hypothetical protein